VVPASAAGFGHQRRRGAVPDRATVAGARFPGRREVTGAAGQTHRQPTRTGSADTGGTRTVEHPLSKLSGARTVDVHVRDAPTADPHRIRRSPSRRGCTSDL